MTTTPTRIASTIPATEDSRTMCFRQGKACVYASEEDGRIIITEPPGGVVERLDTRTGQITGSGPMTANAIGTNGAEINIERVGQRVRSGTGHDVPVPEITRRWSAAQKNLAETAASLGTIDVLDNSHGVTRHVASITKGGIRFPATPTPAWAWALIRQIEQHRPTT